MPCRGPDNFVFTGTRPDCRPFAAMFASETVAAAQFVHREDTAERIFLLVATAILSKKFL